ncbi:MAG: thioredoxin family protein [Planctomycetota bacterium]
MLSLLLAALVAFGTTQDTDDHNYTLAYKKSVEEEKPLMVVVGAEWCPACKVLKNTTIKSMEQNGELNDVNVAVVDRDAQPELAKQLMSGEKMIPQIILYSKSDSGRWTRRRLTGYQPAQPVRTLIRRAVRIGSRG